MHFRKRLFKLAKKREVFLFQHSCKELAGKNRPYGFFLKNVAGLRSILPENIKKSWRMEQNG